MKMWQRLQLYMFFCSHLTTLSMKYTVGHPDPEGADETIEVLVAALPQLRALQLGYGAYLASSTGLPACNTSACLLLLLRHPAGVCHLT